MYSCHLANTMFWNASVKKSSFCAQEIRVAYLSVSNLSAIVYIVTELPCLGSFNLADSCKVLDDWQPVIAFSTLPTTRQHTHTLCLCSWSHQNDCATHSAIWAATPVFGLLLFRHCLHWFQVSSGPDYCGTTTSSSSLSPQQPLSRKGGRLYRWRCRAD